MTIGVWEPAGSTEIDLAKLKEFIELAESADLSKLKTTLPEAFISSNAGVMKRQSSDWQALNELDNEELVLLARFFTLAEFQLPAWEGAKLSPVIYIVKVLKQRDSFDAELRKWIKANTDNRYLPNGAIL